MVANADAVVANVVANKRSGDRHKRTPARAEYMRKLMRQRRAHTTSKA